jgi:DnaK suppressor protein
MERVLTADEVKVYERRLERMLVGLAKQVSDVERNTLEPSGDPQGQRDDESGEDSAFERDREALMTEDHLAYQVREALDRINDGTFGKCETCHRPIARTRLEQVPYANLCATCARQSEAKRAAGR